MEFKEKTSELKRLIETNLSPLINSDYIHLDLPYHSNIGDILIWEGEENFLKTLPYKCLYKSSYYTFRHKKIPENVVVLVHGGGNFGDVWRLHQDFHLNIVKQYPDNKIIIFPQTVFYNDELKLKKDAAAMSKHKNLTICARDKVSYEILRTHFINEVLLVPDMAFCIEPETLNKYALKPVKDILLLKRTDKELSTDFNYSDFISERGIINIHDWPSMEQNHWKQRLLYKLFSPKNPFKNIANICADRIQKPLLVKLGIEFLSQYQYIYTTRLHGMILSILLQKPFSFIDNSYGKNSSFYDTWLSDIETIKIIR